MNAVRIHEPDEPERPDRGDSVVPTRGSCIVTGAAIFAGFVAVALLGTAAALTAGGMWPQIGGALRLLAGIGVACIVAGLLVPFTPGRL